MRRGVGISRVLKEQTDRERWKTLANSISQEQLAMYSSLAEEFKNELQKCIEDYKDSINEDPSLRAEFLEMCDLLGVDPILQVSGGCWSKIGLSDFYCELTVRMLDFCLKSREVNGGLCEISQVIDTFPKELGISQKDLIKCIELCRPFGENSIKTIDVKGQKLILTTPIVMARDHQLLMELAVEKQSGISLAEASERLNCSTQKALSVLNYFIQRQIVWIDECSEGTYYWFPCLFNTPDTKL